VRFMSNDGLGLTAEQESLGRSVRDFFQKRCTAERVRKSEDDGGIDAELWAGLETMGLPTVPSAAGQSGDAATLVDLVLVAEQRGRCLAPVPLVESTVAARLATRADLTEPVWSTIALHPAHGGRVRWVPWIGVAPAMFTLDGRRLLWSRLDDDHRDRPNEANLGGMGVGHGRPREDAVEISGGDRAVAMHHRALQEWKVLTAASLVGLANTAFETALDYVETRKAFGITIGSFQSVAHRFADGVVELDGARLLVFEAAGALDQELPEAGTLAAAAYVYASEVAARVTAVALHVHGGVGYTREHDIQLYFRRARAWPLVLGDPRSQYQQIADALLGDRELVLGH
jgi:alkylation response protein AidB-like acyl-CoA dehydrogenase